MGGLALLSRGPAVPDEPKSNYLWRRGGISRHNHSVEGPRSKDMRGLPDSCRLGLTLSSWRPKTKPPLSSSPSFSGYEITFHFNFMVGWTFNFLILLFLVSRILRTKQCTMFQFSSLSVMILIRFPVLLLCPGTLLECTVPWYTTVLYARCHLSDFCSWRVDPTLLCKSHTGSA